MRNLILFDSEIREDLLPMTYTRPVGELRVGVRTIREQWEYRLQGSASYITQEYLNEKYPIAVGSDNYVINGSVLPSGQLVQLIEQLDPSEALLWGEEEELIAARLDRDQFNRLIQGGDPDEMVGMRIDGTDFDQIRSLPDIFRLNGAYIKKDFAHMTQGRESEPLSDTNRVIGDGAVFLEEGASVEGAIINTTQGPVYIGKDATVMEGSLLRGPLALCEHGTIKMGARIYEDTTIGPWSKVGGEVSNSVILGYSNKGHDGYLGNSVIGEWCNLGADTNVSNLKNNYTEVRLWNYRSRRFEPTGSQFCGLIMADHAKCGINTMFNTGTVVGVAANIFGAGYPRNFLPSFSWGGASRLTTHALDKAYDTAEKMMARRDVEFTHEDRLILMRIFEDESGLRTWEKKS